ncbi:MAG: HAMP domain-containing histidine kinase [Trueperaceae bacterium]|nr:HAMP domain-containing histidine kinase [Trueperaceae bacterium]MCC6310631.1 HAMP domain-containing histidine kinase [Trueperaceae bacterium]MCO5173640.1 HAMP domain-containing histidine kinase [Trueperaceae bacterium]MCW5819851.1 HAMP domain-containing histidine kinase [Trueperaceae bacterium]
MRRAVFVAVLGAVVSAILVEGTLDVWIDQFEDERLFLDLIDIPIMLGIAVLAAWLLARRIGAPLRRLTAATRHVAEQSFDRPLQVPAGRDELAELAASFNAMAATIEGYVERERAFTRYASHELRTPLSAMRLQIERAQLGYVPATEVMPALARGVAQLEEILAALLALARASEPQPDTRSASAVVTDVISGLTPDERGRVRLLPAVADTPVRHARLFQQAVTNLLDNALRHGSGAATVELRVGERFVTLYVNDEGPGLASPYLERATEPFYRAGESDGMGLGLSFVAFLAKALEGDLNLSNSERGLMAELSLPIVAASAAP